MRWLVLGIVCVIGACASERAVAPAGLASKACARVAQSRMEDARVNGWDVKAQQISFRGAYEDCVRWQVRGFEPGIP